MAYVRPYIGISSKHKNINGNKLQKVWEFSGPKTVLICFFFSVWGFLLPHNRNTDRVKLKALIVRLFNIGFLLYAAKYVFLQDMLLVLQVMYRMALH